jgi:transcriptional regulator
MGMRIARAVIEAVINCANARRLFMIASRPPIPLCPAREFTLVDLGQPLATKREVRRLKFEVNKRRPLPLECLRRPDIMAPQTNADQLHGTLDMLVLKTLQPGPQHGYGIAVRLHQLSADVLRVEEGSLYPALYRMEQRGWISSSWGVSENNRRARFYRLTATGRRQLARETDSWRRLAGAVARVLEA